ncbi:MAG: hypothetical protein CVU39_15425 [Chloroflexi bacterium HGW-Chloroflexi-10]|nr:MAG: hypothetical protein CVU39_15425 [Chloroflexi bacterium HGW-Chloroflexi-10]
MAEIKKTWHWSIFSFVLFVAGIFLGLANRNILQIATMESLVTTSNKWFLYQKFWFILPMTLVLFSVFFSFVGFPRIQRQGFRYPVIIIVSILFLFSIVILYTDLWGYQKFFSDFWARSLIVWGIGWLCVWALHFHNMKQNVFHIAVYVFIAFGILFLIVGQIPRISNSPFTLAWSEGSFIYMASAIFDKRIYGVDLPLPYIMSTRHLLESIPFLFKGIPIWIHRLWLVILSLGSAGLLGIIITKKIPDLSRINRFALSLWVVLFVYQGAVYYNILLSVVILIWGYEKNNFRKSFIFMILASIFGGLNRINWAFTPPILFFIVWIIDHPEVLVGVKAQGLYLLKLALWGLSGAIMGIGALFLYYIGLGGYTLATFIERMSATSVWYRLFPSSTFSLGVLAATILTVIFCWIILFTEYSKFIQLPGFQKFLLLSMNLVLFLGSIMVSVKIGGGADLHNMDAFLISTLFTFLFSLDWDKVQNFSFKSSSLLILPMFILMLVPVGWRIFAISPIHIRTVEQDQNELEILKGTIKNITDECSSPPLFIWQRQLITFGHIDNVEVIGDYELVDLIEMAMAENRPYLRQFANDIENLKFSLVVLDPVPENFGRGKSFTEENSLWYNDVVSVVAESYLEKIVLPQTGTTIFFNYCP